MPSVVEYNGKKYIVLGNIRMKNGSFLIALNNKELISVDCSTIENYLKNTNFDIKKSTVLENTFITFIKNRLQDLLNKGLISNYSDINKASVSINNYINANKQLLDNLGNYNDVNNENLLKYFQNVMSQNEYFAEKEKSDNLSFLPDYDEQAVTLVLQSQSKNLDLDKFINKYFDDFNLEQIELLLSGYKISDYQIKRLENKKQILNTNAESNVTKFASRGKTKTFALPGIKESKEAAFIDTLLLSFTVGIFCGIYLMYFILTIMS